jgi:hypothetical protein
MITYFDAKRNVNPNYAFIDFFRLKQVLKKMIRNLLSILAFLSSMDRCSSHR